MHRGECSIFQPDWIVNFFWVFWLGISFTLAIALGFIILHPTFNNRIQPYGGPM